MVYTFTCTNEMAIDITDPRGNFLFVQVNRNKLQYHLFIYRIKTNAGIRHQFETDPSFFLGVIIKPLACRRMNYLLK